LLPRLQNVDKAWNALGDFVQSHMQSINQEIGKQGVDDQFEVQNADILQRLVSSSKGDGKHTLSEQEVVRYTPTC
jgi:hypothetical protein